MSLTSLESAELTARQARSEQRETGSLGRCQVSSWERPKGNDFFYLLLLALSSFGPALVSLVSSLLLSSIAQQNRVALRWQRTSV